MSTTTKKDRAPKEAPKYETPQDIFDLDEDKPDSENTVYVLNISGAEFHVPLPSSDPKTYDTADEIVFDTNEAKKFEKDEILNKRFKRCVELKFLKLISKEEYIAHTKEAKRAAKGADKKASVGYANSGLPKDWKRAIRDIGEMDDVEQLEAYMDAEDRQLVIDAIEARIDELEEA